MQRAGENVCGGAFRGWFRYCLIHSFSLFDGCSKMVGCGLAGCFSQHTWWTWVHDGGFIFAWQRQVVGCHCGVAWKLGILDRECHKVVRCNGDLLDCSKPSYRDCHLNRFAPPISYQL